MKRLALLLVLVASASYAQDISGLLPDSVGAYTKCDSTRIYAGDDLYDLIDGGADIFNEYGFTKVEVRRYCDEFGNYVDAELYEMKDSCSAYGIFSLITFNTGRRIADFPGEAYRGDGFLLLWKGKYYASLTGSDPLNDSGLLRAAVEMTGRIPGSGKPHLVTIFDRMRFTESNNFKAAYIKGGLGLYNLSKISFRVDFSFRDGVCLLTKGVKSIILEYHSEDDCIKEYLVNANDMKNSTDWRPVESGRDSMAFEGQGEFLKLLRLEDYLLVLTSGDRAALERMSEQITEVLVRR